MEMRDEFAKAAMQTLLAKLNKWESEDQICIDWVATVAYDVAEAMLEARQPEEREEPK